MGLRSVNLALRVPQFIFTVIIMALVGNMVADAFHGSASTVNYILFVSAFSMLSLFYLFAAGVSEACLIHPGFMFLVDLLNTIFIFCGAIAMPAKLRVHSCRNVMYTVTNSITRGSLRPEKRCREAQAVTAFLWFLWVVFLISTILSGLSMRGTLAEMHGPRPGRRSRPSMSQV
ncbi:non-classical export protein, conidia-enriched transcript [Histoplasma ohiense]|nr:non-classical export protein, conidia-enriched transcript [Histoplasma ohiense (nom. inval.)]